MSTTTAFPVTIAPEARALIDRVGQREEFELMIDRAKHVVPALTAIEVALALPPPERGEFSRQTIQ